MYVCVGAQTGVMKYQVTARDKQYHDLICLASHTVRHVHRTVTVSRRVLRCHLFVSLRVTKWPCTLTMCAVPQGL
jgi:hypothetical protein